MPSRCFPVFLVLLGSAVLASAALCDPKKGWDNFEIGSGSVPTNPMARSVLDRTIALMTERLKKAGRLPKSCELGRIYVDKDCIKSVIVKNVVKYGVYVSTGSVMYECKNGSRRWFDVITRTNVGRRGNILAMSYNAKSSAGPN